MLQIAQPSNKLLAWNVFIVGEEIPLGRLTGVIDEDIGIGGHAGHRADHIATRVTKANFHPERLGLLIEDVEFLRRCVLL